MFDDLDIFAAVVEHSSLNRASRQLNLSQPALSRKISKLRNGWASPCSTGSANGWS